jgi:hypothetical protein
MFEEFQGFQGFKCLNGLKSFKVLQSLLGGTTKQQGFSVSKVSGFEEFDDFL